MEYQVVTIPIEKIYADPNFNCRGYIAPIDVTELAKDIAKNGLQTPITVQPYNDKYRILAGHRRHKACLLNQMKEIPCFIRTGLSELDARIINLSENVSRKALSLYEEAMALKSLKDLGIGQVECAERLGVSRGWAQIRMMLLDLPTQILEEAKKGNVNQVMVRDLNTMKLKHNTPDQMLEFIRKKKEDKKKIVIRNSEVKKPRTRNEIFTLQEIISDTFKAGLTTRALAWTAGEISDKEMLDTVSETATKLGIDFKRPEDDIIYRTKLDKLYQEFE